ncbi:hypothetical protein [Streptomyces litchfieldiae]|uniref:Uncharacterized protein n=1 Tax=Streptomyces litchfieldiae TaxID=3075543 RepID=A0ABU2MX18_9ACTN|nr:hypothetical protein [Streptomyces sp. DSM 44938]MDT0346021.1 hypothetical protein [Streptomyces sp. DSM 44938]
MAVYSGDQPDDSRPVVWTDPRYADIVARIDALRRDGRPVRGLMNELPADRRPPAT